MARPVDGGGMPPGFYRVIGAQFCSSLADNALLIVAIALLQSRGLPGWWAPMLKFSSTLSYVLLAPFVGPLADAFPKARLMGWTNAVKALGVLAMLAGLNPLLCFGLVGMGAAAYAPAKYGLITELVRPSRLVSANAWLEVSVVVSVLLGTVLGGALVSETLQQELAPWLLQAAGLGVHHAAAVAPLAVLGLYLLAGLLNIGLPDSGARYPAAARHPGALVRDFLGANRTLWRDREGGLSLAMTTLFWGVGATLQFAVLRWAVQVLDLALSQAAYLQAAVAVGVVAGAGLAGRHVGLAQAHRVLPLGIALGLLIPVAAAMQSLWPALLLLASVGAVGGMLVVPMNALLQHRGHTLLTAGRSIAVQNFNENASVMGMLAVYAVLLWLDMPMRPLMTLLGLAVAANVAWLIRRQSRRPAQAAA